MQGTIALELLEQVPDLDAILVAVSGGGLSSGVLMAAKSLNPSIKGVATTFASWKDSTVGCICFSHFKEFVQLMEVFTCLALSSDCVLKLITSTCYAGKDVTGYYVLFHNIMDQCVRVFHDGRCTANHQLESVYRSRKARTIHFRLGSLSHCTLIILIQGISLHF